MATSDRLESLSTMEGGLSNIKTVLQGYKNHIKEAEDKATRMEDGLAAAKEVYERAHTKQKALRNLITETEEELRKKEGKERETKKRLDEKEQFLSEAAVFNENLTFISPAKETAVEEVQAKLKQVKELYEKNNERYLEARNRRNILEDRLEKAEDKARECERRSKALETELEYNIKEESRRAQGCEAAIDAAFKTEKSCMDLEHGLEGIMQRYDIATKKINILESKIEKTDHEIDTVNYERRRVEETIKEMLTNIKQQQAMFTFE